MLNHAPRSLFELTLGGQRKVAATPGETTSTPCVGSPDRDDQPMPRSDAGEGEMLRLRPDGEKRDNDAHGGRRDGSGELLTTDKRRRVVTSVSV